MISNNTSYKLKASKSSRNNHEYQDQEDNKSVDGDATGDSNHRYQVYTSRDGKYNRGAKARNYDYIKGSRGTERRGSYRGRLSTRREYIDGGRYESGVYPYSKYAESEKKAEIKFSLPEDIRISKLLRRLSDEEDQENSLQISRKLLEVLLLPDNAAYIKKSFNILRDSILQILFDAPGSLAKKQCARAFGRMGYILAQDYYDFTKYLKVILKQPSMQGMNNEEMICLFMEALKETLDLDRKNPVLDKNSVYCLMNDLIVIIESTDNVEVFQATLDNLMSCVEFYPNSFCKFFKDTIDLLFGWHVDHTQPLSNIEFISKNLQRISSHFQVNLEFSLTLVIHFIEDIETYANRLVKDDQNNLENTPIEHVTVFILALNTVLKCLKDNTSELITMKLITDALTQVVTTVTNALDLIVPDNLIIAGNESISILLGLLNVKSASLIESVLQLVDLELSVIHDLSDPTIISMMLMISKVIKELSQNLPIELIPKLVGPDSEMIKLRNSPYTDIQEATICVYQALLNLKNIPLLQEAYRYILSDLEVAYKVIVPEISNLTSNPNPFADVNYELEEAVLVCLFLLRCLSQLANASGSIIGMWALKPSILELLGVLLQPYNLKLSKNTPALQYCLLYLLYSHCKCYNYFISSSVLVNDKLKPVGHLGLTDHLEDVSKSPNSGHFSVILDVLYKVFSSNRNYEVQLLELQWLKEIFIIAEPYLEVLYVNEEFVRVVEMIVKCGYCKNKDVILAVGENLEKLLSNKQLSWKNTFLIEVNKLCTLHMASTHLDIRDSYTRLSTNISWDVTILEIGKLHENTGRKRTDLKEYNASTVRFSQQLHINGTLYGEILPHHFKTLMNYLLKNTSSVNLLEGVFSACWPLEADNQELSDQYREICLLSQVVLNNWTTWEAAQLCVNNKLRTTLGKPNETFTSFENSLKQLARDVMKAKQDECKVDLKRVHLLLQFIEHLEMVIYNASEGSALAIPPPSKPVRTFFSTNASTCREWLSRIRIILVQLSLHAGQPVISLRHGQELIKDLYKNDKHDTVDFERAVMYVTMALLNLHESEAIYGLYVWCNNVANKKFPWIKCAADQANRKYEIAAAGYQKIIEEINSDIYIKHFISDQIINCYKELNNWLDIITYKNGNMNLLFQESENGMRYSFNTVNFECAQSLFNMETSTHAFNELTSWKEITNTNSWSVYDTLLTTECDLYNIALNIKAPYNDESMGKIDSTLGKIQAFIQNNILHLPSRYLQEFCLLNYVGSGLKNVINNIPASTVFLVSEDFESEVNKIDSSTLSKILWWSEYFAKVQNQGFNSFSSNLRLNIIKKARKENNHNLASSQLYRFLNNKSLLQPKDAGNGKKVSLLINIAESFRNKIPDINMWTLDTAKAAQEVIKLLYNEPNDRKLAFDLCAIATTSISKCADIYGGVELKQISSKILLKLATWLQTNDHISLTEINSHLGKFLTVLPEIGIENIGSNIIPMNEMVIGKLLQFSVNQCQTLAKTWNAFGTWCYRWGRKIVDNSADLSSTLTADDRANIQAIIPPDCKPEEMNRILLILSQTRTHVDEEDIDSNEINTSEMIRSQLKNVPVLFKSQENIIEALVQIWRNLQKRIYAYYGHSVDAYFKYLHLASNSENVTKATESNTVTVTLRLLRLIVKHALELQNVLEEGLASTPTHPWKIIIPQLFSRLNHPEGYVRERVSELLCRVAEDAPHLITFPAVVGALEGGVKFDFSEISLPKDCLSQNNDCNDDAELNEIEDTYESDDDSKNVLQACFKSMVETLSKQAPETITQVQLLVKELRRIILLWDELWLGTLAQHHTEINKRQQQLELEIEKVNSNVHLSPEEKISLITEKHRIIIKPIIFILEQLFDITSVEPETPHEKQFQERYSDTIEDILQKLKNPEHPDRPQESWKLLKELQNQFQQKAHKRTLLKMQDISPILSNIKDTVISMPGQALRTKVHVSHVSNQVSILPTKTKPKKLIFHGSDGHTYTYLFKGLEDLHLDERIMQFLSIANTMMAQNTEGTGHNLYRARHYSVIPLGPRSGLISWVGGTTPVFALYKRWQQREAAKASKNSITTVLRPSELFYNKLNPLLQEHGVKNIENRKEWPLAVLKQVLNELMSETPSDLLAKELWCHSINPGTWWQMVRKYSYSVAVMSIIGYIIGLGDRHLDNVLVDLNTGEVVHIDYNVCFEKGKTLRVPEKVPFRLTPNIRDALGVTGIEGMFRLACENILKTMKKGRETLLTLLEAFVYDPLVDWTVGNDGLVGTTFGGMSTNAIHKQTRKDLEKEVTLAMYRVRCTEMKMEWDQNKDEILKKIPELLEHFKHWLECHEKSTMSEDLLQDLHQQMMVVKEAEANGICKHSLHTLPARFENYRQTQDTIKTAKKDLDALIKDCETHLERFSDAMKSLQNQQVQQWFIELNKTGEKEKVFDLVKEFLQNAGQANMITQCEQSENEVMQISEQQTVLTLKCLNLLQEYWMVYSQCPVSFLENHRMIYYLKWSKILQNSCDFTTCEHILQQFYAFTNIPAKPGNSILKFSYLLNVLYNTVAGQATKAFEELTKIRSEEPIALLEKHYSEAKLCLSTYLKHEKSASKALEFVIMSELLVLNRTFLTLETAASKSGDWLIKLTSREGDWFLDELTLNSSKAIELINYLMIHNSIEDDLQLMKVVNGLQVANNMYKSLHELNFNFHAIILPESMKKIQSEEPTVMQMIHDLKSIIVNLGIPLQDLVIQLEKQLTCVVMEMDHSPTFELVQNKVTNMKLQYQALLQSPSGVLSPGKMLLMGFNGLFDKLNLESNNIVNTLGNLDVPICWRKLDQVKDAKSLAAPIFNPQVHAILDDIFLLKRLQTMYEFFTMCIEMCQSFQGQDSTLVLSDEQLIKPIRKYIADFISRQFLGITTEAIAYVICFLLQRLGLNVTNEIEQKDIGAENKVPLEELYHKGWNIFIKNGMFTQKMLAETSSVQSNLKSAWEKIQKPKMLEKTVSLLQSTVTRLQNQLTAHYWLHEDILGQQHEKSNFVRSKFISDLRNKTNSLKNLQCRASESREKQKTLINSIAQRLKWAAGANPDLNEILSAFETAITTRDTRLEVEQQISNLTMQTCSTILRHEILRSNTPESKTYDKLFLNSYQKWTAACKCSNMKVDNVSNVEENIMKLYTPDMAHNPKWIKMISEKISDAIKATQKESSDYKQKLTSCNILIVDFINEFKGLYSEHCKVMNDFKNLIKPMIKIDECSVKAQQFIMDYRLYIEHFTNLLHSYKKENVDLADVQLSMGNLDYIKSNTEELYRALWELEGKKAGRPQLVRQEGISLSPMRLPPIKQESMTKGQQRNAYAVSVWRRIRMKLEGRDPDPGRKYTTQEQVDYVIREATSLDNLALLYEGWTPWV